MGGGGWVERENKMNTTQNFCLLQSTILLTKCIGIKKVLTVCAKFSGPFLNSPSSLLMKN